MTTYEVPVEFLKKIFIQELSYFAFFAPTFISSSYYGALSPYFDLEDTASKALGQLALETSLCLVVPYKIRGDVVEFNYSGLELKYPRIGGGLVERVQLIIFLSLSRKRALRATLAGKGLLMTEAFHLAFYAQVTSLHAKVHALANFGVDVKKLDPARVHCKENFNDLYTVYKNAAGANRGARVINAVLGSPFKNIGKEIVEPRFLDDGWLPKLRTLKPFSQFANIVLAEWDVKRHVGPNPVGKFFMTCVHSLDHLVLTEMIAMNSPYNKMMMGHVPATTTLRKCNISPRRLVVINMVSAAFGLSFPKEGVTIQDTLPPYSKALSQAVSD
jgi:hypothetical protein